MDKQQIQSTKQHSVPIVHLSVCGVCLALAFALSYVKILHLPLGGSVTLCSMLFAVLPGYLFGPAEGIMTGLAYSILQFIQGPYVLTPFQTCCDYFLAFTMLGLSGLFYRKDTAEYSPYRDIRRFIVAYLVAVLMRGAFHTLGGYLYWMDGMPDNFPRALAWAYPIIYNYAYLLLEAAITVAVLLLPPVTKVFHRLHVQVGE